MDYAQEGNWWNRNWKWVVPVGSLGLIVGLVGFIALVMSLVFGIIKSSDVYREAVARAGANPAVEAALGKPVEQGFFMTGNVSVSGGAGNANLAIPLSGPKGKATLYAVASKSAGQWSFSTLVLELKTTRARINLLEAKSDGTAPGDATVH